MKISDCMTREVRTITADCSLRDAARLMADMDVGAIPVGEDDRLIGMVTDRDITVRGLGQGHGSEAAVSEVMSREVKYCYEDEDAAYVAQYMGDQQLRRLPVLDRDKRLVGIVTLGDLAIIGMRPSEVGEALGSISRSGGAHSQSAKFH